MLKSYVLITAAKNEEAYIEKLIKSVISQTVLPKKWVIVSDGSTDGTDDIVEKHMAQNKVIQYVKLESGAPRQFSSKVIAINEGLKLFKKTHYNFIGILDADVSFKHNYYENILMKFNQNAMLGVAGGYIFDVYRDRLLPFFTNPENVGGPIQLFRRECFEDVGGLTPMKYGGEDTLALVSARMHGWEVQSFAEFQVLHHKPSEINLRRRFFNGIMEYTVGDHFLYEIVRSISKIPARPFFIGSFLTVFGYLWAFIKGESVIPSPDIVKYSRRDQMNGLRSKVKIKKKPLSK